jgi:hypothetical protein
MNRTESMTGIGPRGAGYFRAWIALCVVAAFVAGVVAGTMILVPSASSQPAAANGRPGVATPSDAERRALIQFRADERQSETLIDFRANERFDWVAPRYGGGDAERRALIQFRADERLDWIGR